MNAQVIKLLVGDSIARIAQRTEIILGKASIEVGEMIAEELAAEFAKFPGEVAGRLAAKEEQATTTSLATRWVAWKEKRVAAKERARQDAEAEAKRKMEGAKTPTASSQASPDRAAGAPATPPVAQPAGTPATAVRPPAPPAAPQPGINPTGAR